MQWWTELDAKFQLLMQVVMFVGTFLAGGKVLRLNKTDVATTNANVASIKAEEVASTSITAEVARLSKMVKEQGLKIDELTELMQAMRDELHKVHTGRKTALKLLNKIHLCGDCDTRFGVLLETAITQLEIETDVPPKHETTEAAGADS